MGTYYLETAVAKTLEEDILDCQDEQERSKLISDYLACVDRIIAEEKIKSQETIEIEKIKMNRRMEKIKTYGGWVVAGVTTIGGWVFANYMANKSFAFEEEGTLSSNTGRKLFRLW